MKCIISLLIVLVHVLHRHLEKMERNAQVQRYNLGHFYFTGHRYEEKFITGFRIDGRTIKWGKLVCISVI
jgi:hypothetical protein